MIYFRLLLLLLISNNCSSLLFSSYVQYNSNGYGDVNLGSIYAPSLQQVNDPISNSNTQLRYFYGYLIQQNIKVSLSVENLRHIEKRHDSTEGAREAPKFDFHVVQIDSALIGERFLDWATYAIREIKSRGVFPLLIKGPHAAHSLLRKAGNACWMISWKKPYNLMVFYNTGAWVDAQHTTKIICIVLGYELIRRVPKQGVNSANYYQLRIVTAYPAIYSLTPGSSRGIRTRPRTTGPRDGVRMPITRPQTAPGSSPSRATRSKATKQAKRAPKSRKYPQHSKS